jgi:hypothetical protein
MTDQRSHDHLQQATHGAGRAHAPIQKSHDHLQQATHGAGRAHAPIQSIPLIAARCAALAGVVLIVTVPVYVWVEPSWRPVVVRLAAAVVLGITLMQLRRALADRLEDADASPLDVARGRRTPEPDVPYHFEQLVRDVRAGIRSRYHFEKVLWPRLASFASGTVVRPPVRRVRGPSLASLRKVIAAIERQR